MTRGEPRPDPEDDLSETTPGLLESSGKVDPEAVRAASAAEGEDDAPTRVAFRVGRDLNKRLDRYLTDRIPFMSRTQLQRLIDNEAVTVNGRLGKASTNLRQADLVEVMLPPPPSSEVTPEEIPLEVLHEDEDLIVLNKAPDIIVHPARSHHSGTMINALAWHFRHRSQVGGELSGVGGEFARPGVVHRLDRNTSGVIVFAKRDEAHWRLGHQFERRQVDKRYMALVHGEMETLADVLEFPVGTHPSREKGYREKYVVRHDELGKHAVTIYRVREVYRGYTLVELELKTGRTHQIRVHLSHIGHPIVGDDMYGGRAVSLSDLAPPHEAPPGAPPIIARQALHATILGFTHPVTGQPMRFTAPLRDDMASLMRALREHRPGAGIVNISGATVDMGLVMREAPATP